MTSTQINDLRRLFAELVKATPHELQLNMSLILSTIITSMIAGRLEEWVECAERAATERDILIAYHQKKETEK